MGYGVSVSSTTIDKGVAYLLLADNKLSIRTRGGDSVRILGQLYYCGGWVQQDYTKAHDFLVVAAIR